MIVPVIKLHRRHVIVDIDTQRHFFSSGGIALVKNHRNVLANVKRVVDWARMKNIRVISTVQIGFPDASAAFAVYRTPDGGTSLHPRERVRVCGRVPKGDSSAFEHGPIYTGTLHYCCNCCPADAECQKKVAYTMLERHTSFPADDCTDLLPEILEQYDQVIFRKRCFDPFEEPRVDRMLSELRADEFILIGAVTEGAVKATALGLLSRHKNVTIPVDAIGSYDRTVGKIAVRRMWVRGAKLVNTKTLVGSCGSHP